jgi:hypothetical protein
MSILTLEGTVDHGQIRLPPNIRLPENTKVYLRRPRVALIPAPIRDGASRQDDSAPRSSPATHGPALGGHRFVGQS